MGFVSSLAFAQNAAETTPLDQPSLGDILRLAEKTSPDLKVQGEREKQAKESSRGLASFYYPHIFAAGATGRGLAGAGSALPGFGGVISSPFGEGPSGDINATWTLLDISQIQGLDAAHYQEFSAREKTRIAKAQVDQAALILYFDAARYRGLENVWLGLVEKIKPIHTLVKNYVKVGRYNQVQLLLLQDQIEQAQLTADTYERQYQAALKRLAVAIEKPVTNVPDAATFNEESLRVISDSGDNPLLGFAKRDVQSAKALSDSASTEGLPNLYATGSIGLLKGVELVPDSNYSASIGISFPLFEGFRIDADQKIARSVFEEKNDQLTAVQRQVDDLNDQYDEALDIARNKISELAAQRDEVDENFKLAKQRYLSLLGTVTDLQASLSNMAQVQTEWIDAQMDALTASGAKKLFNGGSLAATGDSSN